MLRTVIVMHSSVVGDALPAEVNDVTKNAMMWLPYSLNAEEIKHAVLKFADTANQTNRLNRREALTFLGLIATLTGE